MRKSLQRWSLCRRKQGLEKNVKSNCEKTLTPMARGKRLSGQQLKKWLDHDGMNSTSWSHSFILPNMRSQVKCGKSVWGHMKEGWGKASLLVHAVRHDGLCENIKGPPGVEVYTTGLMKEVACHRSLLWNSSKQSVGSGQWSSSWMTDEWAVNYIIPTSILMWAHHKVHI